MFKYWCVRYRYVIVFAIFLLIYSGYRISNVYGFTIFPDEFGYWAYAAGAAGSDWSDIASLGSYYSYGYSLVLFPIFKIFTNPITAYRVAVGANYIFIVVSYLILVWLGQKFLCIGRDDCYVIASVAAFYPGVVFYADTTMVEVMVALVYIIACGLLCAYIGNNKRSALFLFVLSLVYLHFLHMRTVAVLIAGIAVLVVYFAHYKRGTRRLIMAVALATLILLIGFGVKEYFMHSIYGGNTSVSDINDYGGQLGKVKYIFTKDGAIAFIESLSGKILYMGLATYGLAWFGIARGIRRIFAKGHDRYKTVYTFIILSTIGEILISTIYTIHPYRSDAVVYGRYHEFVFPILIMMGICELRDSGKWLSKTVAIIMVELPLTLVAVNCIDRNGLTDLHGYFVAGLSLLYNNENVAPIGFVWRAYISGSLLTIIVAVLVELYTKFGKKGRVCIVGILMVELIYSLRITSIYTDTYSIGTYRDLTVASKIEELRREDSSRRIVYIDCGDEGFVCALQFDMRDEKIEVIDKRDSLGAYSADEIGYNDILVLFYKNPYTDEAAGLYNCGLLDGHFHIFYNK